MLRYLAPAADGDADADADAARPPTPFTSQPSLSPQLSDGDAASDNGGDARVAELTVAVPVGGRGGSGGGGSGGGGTWAAAAARILAARGAVLLTGVLSEEICAGLRALLRQVAADSLTPNPNPNPNLTPTLTPTPT